MKTFGWSSQETQHSRTEMSWADGAQATVKHYGVQLNAKRQQLIQSSQSNPCSDVIKYVHRSEEIKMMGHFQVSSQFHGSCSMKTLPKLFNSTLLTRALELSQFRSKIQVKMSNQLELLPAKLFNSFDFLSCRLQNNAINWWKTKLWTPVSCPGLFSALLLHTGSPTDLVSLLCTLLCCFCSILQVTIHHLVKLHLIIFAVLQHFAESEQSTALYISEFILILHP